jgi:adenylate cyclase
LQHLLRKFWKKWGSKYAGRWVLGLALVLLASLQVWSVFNVELIDRMDAFIYGMRLRIQTPVLDRNIVIIDIDEKSLTEIGRFPWSRDKMADLVTALSGRYQARAIGFDITFSEPDTSSGYDTLAALAERQLKDTPGFREQLQLLQPTLDYDGRLAKAIKDSPAVLGYVLSAQQKKGVLPSPVFMVDDLNGRQLHAQTWSGYEANIAQLQQVAKGGGFFTASTDADGILRSSPLLQKIGDAYYPALSLATAYVAYGATSIRPYYEETVDKLSQAQLDAGGVDAISMYYPTKKRLNIRVSENLRALIQFRGKGGPRGGAFRYVSAADVMRGRTPVEDLRGTIMLIGTTAPGLNDLRATPVNSEYPGVEVHANLIKSMLDQRFKYRPYYGVAIEFGQILLFGLILSLILPTLTPGIAVTATAVVVGLAIGMNFLLYFQYDWVLNGAILIVMVASLFVMNVVWGYLFEYRNRQAIVGLFGEYVAPELVEQMADNPADYNMEGESRELTVLFVDVRGFTTISEGLTPKALREYINIYLTAMSEDIRGNRGTLDKYIGDAVMAFWGAPVELPDHASRAVGTALKMLATASRLNDEFVARGWPQLKIGIGLNSGQMHVGDMGSRIRRAYTVMGDAVNLGSRLEGITKVYGVGLVVGDATRAAAPEFFYRELDCVRVKGKNEPIPIFEPIGEASKIDARVRGAVDRWQRAYGLIRLQKWDEAQEILQALNRQFPSDVLYQLYLERIAYYRQHPPGPNWDGVTTFETK